MSPGEGEDDEVKHELRGWKKMFCAISHDSVKKAYLVSNINSLSSQAPFNLKLTRVVIKFTMEFSLYV